MEIILEKTTKPFFKKHAGSQALAKERIGAILELEQATGQTAGGGVDFTQKFFVLGDNPNNLQSLDELTKAGVNVLTYGNFLTILINFIILAWVVFLMVKMINRMRRKQEEVAPEPAATPEDIQLLREIRDELKNKS